jgi:lipoyl(octanoyl) transferase
VEGYWTDLGLMQYVPAFSIQQEALQARMQGRLPPTVLLQETPPTFTIGRSGSRENVLASPEELKARGIEVIEVDRGGDVTYHGPGQLIASPLFYLGDLDVNANQYMHRLEDVLAYALAAFGLTARRHAAYPGAWIGQEKIGAVGIGVRHGYTFHGISLNVNLDLLPFGWINPCGVARMPVTSMQAALGHPVEMQKVRAVLRTALEAVFGVQLRPRTVVELQTAIQNLIPLPDPVPPARRI